MGFFMRTNGDDRGQSLVLILLVLIIGAVIAFAIAARTIQDIRRTGLERLSDQAGTQVETMLDVITSPVTWDSLISDGGFTGECQDADSICQLSEDYLNSILGGTECDTAEVGIRIDDDLSQYPLNQDDVYELSLPDSSGTFGISWTGSTYLLIKVYAQDGDTYTTESSIALTHDGVWGESVADGVSWTVAYSENAKFARIKPISGDAEISIVNIPAQEVSVKASCYVGSVYREFIRRVPLHNSVPACFDYVLFDGSSKIEEFGN